MIEGMPGARLVGMTGCRYQLEGRAPIVSGHPLLYASAIDGSGETVWLALTAAMVRLSNDAAAQCAEARSAPPFGAHQGRVIDCGRIGGGERTFFVLSAPLEETLEQRILELYRAPTRPAAALDRGAASRREPPGRPPKLIGLLTDILAICRSLEVQDRAHGLLQPGWLGWRSGRPAVIGLGIWPKLAPGTPLRDVFGHSPFLPRDDTAGHGLAGRTRGDVYALGAILYMALTGAPPLYRDAHGASGPIPVDTLRALRFEQPEPPGLEELIELQARCMHPDVSERPPSVSAFTAALSAWLDRAGAQQAALSARALETRRIEAARALHRSADTLLEQSRALRDAADRQEAAHRAGDGPSEARGSLDDRRKGWAIQDDAEDKRVRAEALEMHTAFALYAQWKSIGLDSARDALSGLFKDRLRRAGHRRDQAMLRRTRALAEQLLADDPASGVRHTPSFDLVTRPVGARVSYRTYQADPHDRWRQLVLGRAIELHGGPTPLKANLPSGSYRLTITRAGYHTTHYPICLDESGPEGDWSSVRPGGDHPHPIRLPESGELGPDDCYVPAGFFICGGDPHALEGFPRRRIWLDGFVIKRHPVTREAYARFLTDVITGGTSNTLYERLVPPDSTPGGMTLMQFDKTSSGFEARHDDTAHPEMPVCLITWHAAVAYARWFSERDKLSPATLWRLPHEFEWEKAARGVDGRIFPWGDHLDPAWSRIGPSSRDQGMVRVDEVPRTDTSPYGMRGAVGNVRDWCANRFTYTAPVEGAIPDLSHRPEVGPEDRVVRGGAWQSAGYYCHPATRMASLIDAPGRDRFSAVGFRLVRCIDGEGRQGMTDHESSDAALAGATSLPVTAHERRSDEM